MNTHAHKMECNSCGEIELAFSYFIREEYPGDPGDVYTVGEEWECENCGAICTFFDSEKGKARAERATARRTLRELSAALDRAGDPWGWGMGLWFDLCAALINSRASIPAAWEYRPSPLGVGVECDYTAECIADLPAPVLLRMGETLHRYTRACDRAGLSY